MDDFDTQLAALANAFANRDEERAGAALVGLGTIVIRQVIRIADALETIAGTVDPNYDRPAIRTRDD